jgi:hypothetical protein
MKVGGREEEGGNKGEGKEEKINIENEKKGRTRGGEEEGYRKHGKERH